MSEAVDPVTFDQLLRNVMFAADDAAISAKQRGHTPHEVTKLAVTEAFRCALGNGLIAVVPREQWPEYVSLEPPYRPGPPWATS